MLFSQICDTLEDMASRNEHRDGTYPLTGVGLNVNVTV